MKIYDFSYFRQAANRAAKENAAPAAGQVSNDTEAKARPKNKGAKAKVNAEAAEQDV